MSRPLIDPPPHKREPHKALRRGPLKALEEEVQNVPKKKRVSVRWTNEEHMRFLEGLLALGKGEWGRIARDYVITKNTTQVTSHAQKHFLHQSSKNAGKQRKGSSIFDLHPPPLAKADEQCLWPSA
ncbi:hypothetical protein QJS10_CPB21g01241 [Acorus calamus]|uniref:MYB transcription factor n=1 Tax=Acorus calamus TaxID=4465 RepID=A0AAV9C4Y8_ACOCL|nr:hypothetical protein QJS10_CPB21g01241 [Acorus calamus]